MVKHAMVFLLIYYGKSHKYWAKYFRFIKNKDTCLLDETFLICRELRLTEALHEPHICDQILNYNVHAERAGSMRYGKGQSETMGTLHDLV